MVHMYAKPRRPPRPAPAAVTPISRRLEALQEQERIPSLKDFWRELGEEEGSGVGYEAVRNYHYDRDPPVSYLVAVVRRFPAYRLEWLATGEGKPTHDEEAFRVAEAWQEAEFWSSQASWRMIQKRLPILQELDMGAEVAALRLLNQTTVLARRLRVRRKPALIGVLDLAETFLHGPARVWGEPEGPPPPILPSRASSYAITALTALTEGLELAADAILHSAPEGEET